MAEKSPTQESITSRPLEPRQKAMKTFQLRYKAGYGIEYGFVEAESLAKAEEIGREWCAAEPRRAFLAVKDPVLVRQAEWEVKKASDARARAEAAQAEADRLAQVAI